MPTRLLRCLAHHVWGIFIRNSVTDGHTTVMRKVVVFVSSTEADKVCDVIARTGGSRIGNYSESIARAPIQGYGALQALDEKKIEFACDDDTYAAVVAAIDTMQPQNSATVDSWSLETFALVR